MMTPQEFAARLHGRAYPFSLSKAEDAEAKAAGLVVVYGASDDLMEFEGAIRDEVGAYEGTTAAVSGAGPLVSWDSLDKDSEAEVQAYFDKKRSAREIEAIWCPPELDGTSWAYKTDIPYATFDVMEDGEIYCRGIVFRLSELAAPQAAPLMVNGLSQAETSATASVAGLSNAAPRFPFGGHDPKFCPGSNPECPQEFPEQRFPNELPAPVEAKPVGASDTVAMANYTLSISADSGYESTTEGRCTSLQYSAAIAALHGAAPVATAVPSKEALTDLVAGMLSGTHHCTRAWSAWGIGTMSEDDFSPVDESDTPGEIADAVLAMLAAAPVAAQPLTEQWMALVWASAPDPIKLTFKDKAEALVFFQAVQRVFAAAWDLKLAEAAG